MALPIAMCLNIRMRFCIALLASLFAFAAGAGEKALSLPKGAPPPIHVKGRHIIDNKGNVVRFRGTMRSINSWFDGQRWGGGDDDAAVERCLDYSRKLHAAVTDNKQGTYCNMIRLTDDGQWSLGPETPERKVDVERFDVNRFKRNFDRVFIPVIEDAIAHGMYVVLRPSLCGYTDHVHFVGDRYHEHLKTEWKFVASHKRIQALGSRVVIELMNEPVTMAKPDGTTKDDDQIVPYMQELIDLIRKCGFKGIILASGGGYQSWYGPFAKHPLKDRLNNLGFAVHVYSGWYGQPDEKADRDRFIANFAEQVPVVLTHPVVITECDWSTEEEGEGKLNEFGQRVKKNKGTWATASTSRWGRAWIGCMEYYGNIGMICGDTNCYVDLDDYLKTGVPKKRFDGDPECCSAACWRLYAKWAKAKPKTPAELDAPHQPAKKAVAVRTVEQLTRYPFRIKNTKGKMLAANYSEKDKYNHEMSFKPEGEATDPGRSAWLFRAAVATNMMGKTYHRLKCYRADGLPKVSHVDWRNGDSVSVSRDGRRLQLMPARQNCSNPFGHDEIDFAGLWEIEKVRTGFVFKSAAFPGKYLSDKDGVLADEPMEWSCISQNEITFARYAPSSR